MAEVESAEEFTRRTCSLIHGDGPWFFEQYAFRCAAESRDTAIREAAKLELPFAEMAAIAYAAIMKDLLGRCGIENAFDEIDDDIRAEITETCVAKAERALRAKYTPATETQPAQDGERR